jgi:hypothetical protein
LNSATPYLYQEDLYKVPSPLVIILSRPWHNILEDEKALLAKILGSVRINIDSVTIVYQPNVEWEALAVFNPARVLIFGSQLSGDIKPYENVMLNGIAVIKADDLGNFDDTKKKSLWVALKQMFSV